MLARPGWQAVGQVWRRPRSGFTALHLATWLTVVAVAVTGWLAAPDGVSEAQAQVSELKAESAEAERATQSVMVLFDGSGSMWGVMPGGRQSKLVVTRDALKRQLQDIPESMRIGLASFGHRRAGDCTDAGVISAMDEARPEFVARRIFAPLDRLNPRGKGPIGAGLRAATQEVASNPGQRHLVLLHDDPDNCGVDLCALLPELTEAAPNLRIHVIGLALPERLASAYQCLSSATGGRHIDVRSAAEVDDAVAQVLSSIQAVRPATAVGVQQSIGPSANPEPRAIDPIADGPPHLRLRALLAPGTALPQPVPLEWQLTRTQRLGSEPTVNILSGQDQLVPVEPGQTYAIEIAAQFATAATTVTAPAKGHLVVEVPLSAGQLRLTGPASQEKLLSIYRADKSPMPKSSAMPGRLLATIVAPPERITLPAGDYVLRFSQRNHRFEQRAQLTAGATLDLDSGQLAEIVATLELPAPGSAAGPTSQSPVIVSLEEDDPLSPSGRKELARSAATMATFVVPPGTYTLTARQGQNELRERVAAVAGQRTEVSLRIAASRLVLAARWPDLTASGASVGLARAWYSIQRLDVPTADPILTFGDRAVLDLAPGRYRVTGETPHSILSASEVVELVAGETHALVLEPRAGTLVLKNARPEIGIVRWQILGADGRRHLVAAGQDRLVVLAPGRYMVRARGSGVEAQKDITVETGSRQEIVFGE